VWPPPEPPGIDILAHRHLGPRYQRVRSLNECKYVLAYHSPLVSVSLGITSDWYHAPKGRIPERVRGEPTVSAHAVSIIGYDDSTQLLKFINTWGPNWGDRGCGYISYRTFERTWVEGWCFFPEKQRPTGPEPGLKERSWAASEFGGGLVHVREIVGPNEDRIAWSFVIQRKDSLDVEELFVKPEHRGKGYGKSLARSLWKLAFEVQQYPRIWIPYPDTTPENLLILENLFKPVGLQLVETPVALVRWAPFVACKVEEEPHPSTLQPSKVAPPRRRRRTRAGAAPRGSKR
jgi:GNAT superfamily N-acetyltransferase